MWELNPLLPSPWRQIHILSMSTIPYSEHITIFDFIFETFNIQFNMSSISMVIEIEWYRLIPHLLTIPILPKQKRAEYWIPIRKLNDDPTWHMFRFKGARHLVGWPSGRPSTWTIQQWPSTRIRMCASTRLQLRKDTRHLSWSASSSASSRVPLLSCPRPCPSFPSSHLPSFPPPRLLASSRFRAFALSHLPTFVIGLTSTVFLHNYRRIPRLLIQETSND